MSVIMNKTTVAAGLTNNNLVSGSAFEFARGRQLAMIGAAIDVTGGLLTIQSGSEVILEESPVQIKAGGLYPIIPDEMYYTDFMENNDRLVLRARNIVGGNVVFAFVVQLSPTK